MTKLIIDGANLPMVGLEVRDAIEELVDALSREGVEVEVKNFYFDYSKPLVSENVPFA